MARLSLGTMVLALMVGGSALAADAAAPETKAGIEAAASEVVEGAEAVEAAVPKVEAALEAAVVRVQKAYENMNSIQADVAQTSRLSSLAKEETQMGSLLLAKPGKMHWKFTEPREQLFISDGAKIYIYNPGEKQLIIQPLSPEGGVGVDFLLGLGKIHDQFEVEGVSEAEYLRKGRDAMLLTPKKPSGAISKLIFSVDGESGLVQEVWTFDPMGNRTHLAFSNLVLNGEVDVSLFTFTAPEGVEVLDGTGGF